MAWERRGNREYYYTARREGARVVKEYVHPLVAEYHAAIDEDRRRMREAAAAEARAALAELADLAGGLAPLDELADAAVAAALVAAGYHRHHRGPWRKRLARAEPAEADRPDPAREATELGQPGRGDPGDGPPGGTR